MLINLSNHPLTSWSKIQIETANKLFGEVIDLEFPKIPPEAHKNFILDLSNKYKSKCINILNSSSDNNNAVHIMGELTFTFNLVTELKKNDIVCVASTTGRKIVQENGAKTSYFRFVKFREY